MTRATICARCSHFRFRDDKNAVYPQIAHGIGRCDGFDGHVVPTVQYVRWNAWVCILYGLAKDAPEDAEKRRGWIDKQIAKDKNEPA